MDNACVSLSSTVCNVSVGELRRSRHVHGAIKRRGGKGADGVVRMVSDEVRCSDEKGGKNKKCYH